MRGKQCRYRIIGWSYGCINAGYALRPNYLNNGTVEGRATTDAEIEKAYAAARRVFEEDYDFDTIYRHRHDAETKAKELEDVTDYKWALTKCYIGDDDSHPDDDEQFIEPSDDDPEDEF
jgi:hypothetical protein